VDSVGHKEGEGGERKNNILSGNDWQSLLLDQQREKVGRTTVEVSGMSGRRTGEQK